MDPHPGHVADSPDQRIPHHVLISPVRADALPLALGASVAKLALVLPERATVAEDMGTPGTLGAHGVTSTGCARFSATHW